MLARSPEFPRDVGMTGELASTVGADRAPLMKTRDVALYLGMSREQVWRLWSSGKLAGYKFDRHVRFAQADVDAFLAQAYTGERATRQKHRPVSHAAGNGPYTRI